MLAGFFVFSSSAGVEGVLGGLIHGRA